MKHLGTIHLKKQQKLNYFYKYYTLKCHFQQKMQENLKLQKLQNYKFFCKPPSLKGVIYSILKCNLITIKEV